MEILSSIFYFVIVLGILVFVHEFGHFLMARLSGMRVETFALGMGFRLFGWNKKTGLTLGKLPENLELEGNTDYRIAAFPIGGYCTISGMVDESFDTKAISQEPQPYEFRAKNAFQKCLATAGGVLFNLLLAILIFSFLIYKNGKTDYNTTKISYVAENSIGEKVGLLAGDEIISINGEKVSTWDNLTEKLALSELGDNKKIELTRNGIDTIIVVSGKEIVTLISSEVPVGLEPAELKTIVMRTVAGSLAEGLGLKENDTILAVNGINVTSNREFISKMQANKGKNIVLDWKSGNSLQNQQVQLDATGTIGIQISQIFTGKITHIEFGIAEAIVAGTSQTFSTLSTIISSIKQIIIGNIEFKKAIGGPVIIAQQASQFANRGFASFLSFTAMLSISLAFINILPFPALDGGHIIIVIIEAIIRREIPLNAKLILQQAGMYLLLGLMLYVIINDVLKLV